MMGNSVRGTVFGRKIGVIDMSIGVLGLPWYYLRAWFNSNDAEGAREERGKGSPSSTSALPRIALRIQVQIMDVHATNGIRNHIGEKAKLTSVAGTQIFHSAGRSS